MHAVIVNDLEQYLSGRLPPSALDRFQAHLATCGKCRREVDEIQESIRLLASLKPAGVVDPPPSFVAQGMQTVAERLAASFWADFWAFAGGGRGGLAFLLTL